MRVLLAAALLLAACTDTSIPGLRTERQTATLADAKATSWIEGGAVLVAVPGTFSFPQPLSLRISVVDSEKLDANMMPTQLKISSATLAPYNNDAGVLTVKTDPACAQNFCAAELVVSAQGSGILVIQSDGPDGKFNDCFYYGVYEADDTTAAGEMYRTELEQKQRDCRRMFWN